MEIRHQLDQSGFAVVPRVYTEAEIHNLVSVIESAHGTQALFGERRFLQRTPGLLPLLLNESLRKLLHDVAPGYFIIKSIYFDKLRLRSAEEPASSNWRVNWHQDLSIFVKEKTETYGFRNWTKKEEEYGVQPPAEMLGNIITIRIHLDDADETNGALKVIPHSHSIGVMRAQTVSFSDSDAVVCEVKAGDVMLMKPLLFHSSARSESERRRRVLHLELCSMELPEGLEWSQKIDLQM